jgi:hypothetical protein
MNDDGHILIQNQSRQELGGFLVVMLPMFVLFSGFLRCIDAYQEDRLFLAGHLNRDGVAVVYADDLVGCFGLNDAS